VSASRSLAARQSLIRPEYGAEMLYSTMASASDASNAAESSLNSNAVVATNSGVKGLSISSGGVCLNASVMT